MRPLLAVLFLLTAFGVAACGGQREPTEEGGRLSIATGNTTGVYYQLGGAMAQLASRETDTRVNASETGASAQNVKLVVAGDQDIGFSLLDTAADAVEGRAGFDSPQGIQALMGLYPNTTHVAVRTDSGIESIEDMRGKAISTGSPQSGTEVIAERLLGQAGLDPDDDIDRQRLELGASVEGMKDGAIDGLVWSGGLPTPGIEDLFTTLDGEVELLDVTDQLAGLQDEYGDVYEEAEVPADTYSGQTEAVPSINVGNVLFVADDFDEDLAEELVTTFLEGQPQLADAVPAAKDISPESAMETAPLELNAGAQRAIEAAGGQ